MEIVMLPRGGVFLTGVTPVMKPIVPWKIAVAYGGIVGAAFFLSLYLREGGHAAPILYVQALALGLWAGMATRPKSRKFCFLTYIGIIATVAVFLAMNYVPIEYLERVDFELAHMLKPYTLQEFLRTTFWGFWVALPFLVEKTRSRAKSEPIA